jgi:isopentenyldiphosphate isomerase
VTCECLSATALLLLTCLSSLGENDLSQFYRFHISGYQAPFGHVPPQIKAEWFWDSSFWTVCDIQRTLTLHGTSVQERDANIRKTLTIDAHMKRIGIASVAGEAFPVYSHQKELVVNIPRVAAQVFGILAYGVQLVAYDVDETASDPSKLNVWLSRRSKHKTYFPGALDVTASGALAAGEGPVEGIVREALEEASLPEAWLRTEIRAMGMISYVGRSGNRTDADLGFALPEIDFCYSVKLPSLVQPKPMDDEVEYFKLLSVSDVLEQLLRRQFSPSATCVLVDFLIKRGCLTHENLPGYIEIDGRLQQKLLYPTL